MKATARKVAHWEPDVGAGSFRETLLHVVLILLAMLALMVLPALLSAQVTDDVVQTRSKAIAAQLRCPVCQGQSLQDSQSELSAQMKAVIADQVRAGKSDDQVLDYFVAKYGEWILLEPRAHGFNLAVYILPFVVLIGGMGVLYLSVKRWTAASSAA